MILRGIKLARSWHLLIRVGIATVAVAAATALQLPTKVDLPGEPFLLYFFIVLVSAVVFGRTPGFVAVAETTIASVLYFDPTYSLRLTHAVDLLEIEIYSVVAALSVEALCRLVDSALAEKSEAKLARIQHKEVQARLAAIVTSSADAIVGKTLDGIVTSWNEAAERMFGYSADEMIGQSIRRLVPSDSQAEEDSILSRMARSESIERHEMMLLAKDGRTFDASITISPIRDAEGRNIGCSKIIRDITARKQAEALLRRQADLLDLSHDAIFTWKIGGGITYWSRGAERLYGYTTEDATGRSSHELLRTRSPIPMHEVEALIAREGRWYGELTHTTREGLMIVVESRHVRVSYNSETYVLETNRDITARKRAEEELRKSEERFKSSLFHSPLPVLLFDDREQIVALSQSWLEETGYSREELHRIEDWTTRAYGKRSGPVLKHIRRIISTEPEAQRAERIIRTKDGRDRLWNFVSSALGTQSDGRRLFVSVAQDVTERKAHEEQIHFLMHEANHRAKNILGLVQAIARQTATRSPEDFIGRFTERIQALAANQDLLVRNKWQGIDVEDLVRAQLAHFGDLVGSRIAMHGPRLRVNAAAAQAIGLTLHELATNAGKYGALSTDSGRIDACWETDRDALTMSWTERDGPPVSPPERRGFGSTVIASMVKAAVGGEVQLDYAPSGLVWRLTCPAANLLEPRGPEQTFSEAKNRTDVSATGRVNAPTAA